MDAQRQVQPTHPQQRKEQAEALLTKIKAELRHLQGPALGALMRLFGVDADSVETGEDLVRELAKHKYADDGLCYLASESDLLEFKRICEKAPGIGERHALCGLVDKRLQVLVPGDNNVC